MTRPKISVVVPVYNAERYLNRCIESVLAQTEKETELILVNDCSPDDSLSIIRRYAEQDSRVRAINFEKNRGPMIAREAGYLAALGRYITFCDSDDSLPPDALATLAEALEKNPDAGIVSGDWVYIDINGKETVSRNALSYGNDKISVYRALFRGELSHTLCGKLFKSELLKKIKYENEEFFTNGEDGMLFYQIVENCGNVVQIDRVVYNYFQNVNSSSNRRRSENGIRGILRLNKIREQIAERYPQFSKDAFCQISRVLNGLYRAGYNRSKFLDTEIRKLGLEKYAKPSVMLKKMPIKEALPTLLKRFFFPIRKNK